MLMKNNIDNTRVAVTGLGVVAPGSIGINSFWKNMSRGRVFTGELTAFDRKGIRCAVSGEVVPDEEYIKLEKGIYARCPEAKSSRAQLFAVMSALQAVNDGGLSHHALEKEDVYIAVGSTMGIDDSCYISEPLEVLAAPERETLEKYAANRIPESIRTFFGLDKAVSHMFMNACAAGNYAIASSYNEIKNGRCSLALAGGVDALCYTAVMGFNRLLSVTPDICRPFDKGRRGMIVGEGSAFLLLEPMEHAAARGAHIYAELSGCGLGADAYHITTPRPDGQGAVTAIKRALRCASLQASDIDYISAHGTGTMANDAAESKALVAVFGENPPPTSSIKSMIGHTLGAAGAIEAVACCLMMENQEIIPTANFTTPDENCPVDCVPNKSRKARLNHIVSNALAFGGNNSSVIFSKPGILKSVSTVKNKPQCGCARARILAVHDFSCDDLDKYYAENMPHIDIRTSDIQSKLLTAAIFDTMKSAAPSTGLSLGDLPKESTAIVSGSNTAALAPTMNFLHTARVTGALSVSPMAFPNTVANAAASRASIWLGFRDKVIALSDGPLLSGLDALLKALETVNADSDYAFAAAIENESATVALVGRII